ncbi:MAG: hypothetical protein M1339_05470 [Bacteroidetes bacterium]|nr:hypothetical protein [Bacteroidota bacterium]
MSSRNTKRREGATVYLRMLKIWTAILFLSSVALAQDLSKNDTGGTIGVSGFYDGAHHWYDVHDEDHVIDT